MRIVMASSEVSPHATTGGLGEVVASLPRALAALGLPEAARPEELTPPQWRTFARALGWPGTA